MPVPVTTPQAPPRAAIITVDDDPGVSRAVARDLRRRYGESHRIVRAESPAAALDALRQMKLRGDQVAIILADYRMPQMSGIEFLEQAMDLYPAARRVLLTAYADTDAAIDAINVVDLDHYLLKPWDPPEEKLYPVVDALLEAWRESDHRPVPETKVVGHRWSARSSEVREFLARNQVPYRWYMSDEPEGERLLAAAGADGLALPVVITPDGESLVEPTDAELATRVGLSTTPSADFYDLVVIGGGPAGLGAAVYGASEGLRTVLVERTAAGGQAGQSSRIENYLGFPDGVSGAQLTDRARRQAAKFGAEMLTTRDVVGLEVNGSARTVRFADGGSIDAHTVILATGVSYRQLTAPGLAGLTGRGIFYGSSLTESSGLRGPGRVHRRRRELGRAGGGLPVARRQLGDDPGPGPVARGVDVLLPRPADREDPRNLGPYLHRGRRRARHRSSEAADPARQQDRLRPRRSTRSGCSSSSAPHRARTGWTASWCGMTAASWSPAPTCPSMDSGRGAGRLTGRRTIWRPASRVCSWPATRGRSRPSGSPPRSGRAPWP